MSAEFQSIDESIDASYQNASQVETMARQLEARISKIDGAKRHLPQRNYGQPVDLAKIRSNLTLTSLIAQDSAELAHYCGIDPSIRHRIDEQRRVIGAGHLDVPDVLIQIQVLVRGRGEAGEDAVLAQIL